jgi:hypothetical protein
VGFDSRPGYRSRYEVYLISERFGVRICSPKPTRPAMKPTQPPSNYLTGIRIATILHFHLQACYGSFKPHYIYRTGLFHDCFYSGIYLLGSDAV